MVASHHSALTLSRIFDTEQAPNVYYLQKPHSAPSHGRQRVRVKRFVVFVSVSFSSKKMFFTALGAC
jgi:hypothetical protein